MVICQAYAQKSDYINLYLVKINSKLYNIYSTTRGCVSCFPMISNQINFISMIFTRVVLLFFGFSMERKLSIKSLHFLHHQKR